MFEKFEDFLDDPFEGLKSTSQKGFQKVGQFFSKRIGNSLYVESMSTSELSSVLRDREKVFTDNEKRAHIVEFLARRALQRDSKQYGISPDIAERLLESQYKEDLNKLERGCLRFIKPGEGESIKLQIQATIEALLLEIGRKRKKRSLAFIGGSVTTTAAAVGLVVALGGVEKIKKGFNFGSFSPQSKEVFRDTGGPRVVLDIPSEQIAPPPPPPPPAVLENTEPDPEQPVEPEAKQPMDPEKTPSPPEPEPEPPAEKPEVAPPPPPEKPIPPASVAKPAPPEPPPPQTGKPKGAETTKGETVDPVRDAFLKQASPPEPKKPGVKTPPKPKQEAVMPPQPPKPAQKPREIAPPESTKPEVKAPPKPEKQVVKPTKPKKVELETSQQPKAEVKKSKAEVIWVKAAELRLSGKGDKLLLDINAKKIEGTKTAAEMVKNKKIIAFLQVPGGETIHIPISSSFVDSVKDGSPEEQKKQFELDLEQGNENEGNQKKGKLNLQNLQKHLKSGAVLGIAHLGDGKIMNMVAVKGKIVGME